MSKIHGLPGVSLFMLASRNATSSNNDVVDVQCVNGTSLAQGITTPNLNGCGAWCAVWVAFGMRSGLCCTTCPVTVP